MVGKLWHACSLTLLLCHFSKATASLLSTPTNDVYSISDDEDVTDSKPEDSPIFLKEKSKRLDDAESAMIADMSVLKKINPALLFESDENQWQHIHEATRSGFLNAIEFLLKEGADINALCSYGTPLDVAIESFGGSHPIVQKLRVLGALSAIELNEMLYTASEATNNGDVPALKKIAQRDRALLFESDENQWQPIHEAARGGFVNVIEYLLQEGADINALCSYGTPLDIAIDYLGETHPIVQKIQDLGGLSAIEIGDDDDHHDTENNAYTAIEAANIRDVSALKKIAEIDKHLLFEPDENDWQPIHAAARGGFVNVIEYLLQEGADINALCPYGTPLDIAIEYLGESHPIVQKLRHLGGLSEKELVTGDKDDVEDFVEYYLVDDADDFVNDELYDFNDTFVYMVLL